MKYPKYGASERPLHDIAEHSVCIQCGERGLCIIEEQGKQFGSARAFEIQQQRVGRPKAPASSDPAS